MPVNIKINTNHLELSPALEKHTMDKMSHVQKVMNKITNIHVMLSIDKRNQKAEAELHIAGDSKPIFAEATSEDMYKSIDELEHKLLRQVVKYNEILKGHRGE